MTNLQNLSSSQLRKVVAIKERIEALEAELASVIGDIAAPAPSAAPSAPISSGRRGPRSMSPAARERIAAAQRARWAKFHASSGKASAAPAAASTDGRKRRRRMSPAARAKLAAIAKARWAKAKASGKSVL